MTSTGLALSGLSLEAEQLARDLTFGKPELGWKGDPRLELRIGILTASKSGIDPRSGRWKRAGDKLGMQYQVWRVNEDGTEKQIIARAIEAFYTIIPELVQMDPRTPGFRSTFERAEESNAAVDKANTQAVQEAQGEATEHLWRLVADRQNGPSTFRQIPGRNPDKQL